MPERQVVIDGNVYHYDSNATVSVQDLMGLFRDWFTPESAPYARSLVEELVRAGALHPKPPRKPKRGDIVRFVSETGFGVVVGLGHLNSVEVIRFAPTDTGEPRLVSVDDLEIINDE